MRAAAIIAHERLEPVAVINHSYTDAVPIGAAFVERPASDNQRRVRRKRLLGKESLRERRQGPGDEQHIRHIQFPLPRSQFPGTLISESGCRTVAVFKDAGFLYRPPNSSHPSIPIS